MEQRLTRHQLRVGAEGIAYRARQLASIAVLVRHGLPAKVDDPAALQVINNALVESALVNARVLAWFFSGKNVCSQDFLPGRSEEVGEVTADIVSVVSRHLGHAMENAPEGELHPGEWPVPELAVVLVDALDRFVSAYSEADAVGAASFRPSPSETAEMLRNADVLATPTAASENSTVGRLTKALQSHLAELLASGAKPRRRDGPR